MENNTEKICLKRTKKKKKNPEKMHKIILEAIMNKSIRRK